MINQGPEVKYKKRKNGGWAGNVPSFSCNSSKAGRQERGRGGRGSEHEEVIKANIEIRLR